METVHPANVFIDLRERKDYEEGHIDGFINLPTCDSSEVLDYLNKKDLKKKSIYVICYKGRRSAATIEQLHKNGYKHLSYITFGYDDYVESQHDFKPKTGECDCLAD